MENSIINIFRCGVKCHTDHGRDILISRPYNTIVKTEDGFKARAEICCEEGNFSFYDKIYLEENCYKVEINLTVNQINSSIDGIGIHSGFCINELHEDLQFFMPSAWYGDEELFAGKSNKYPYANGIAGGGIDGIGAPVCAVFSKRSNNSYSIEVVNPQYDTVLPNDKDYSIDARNKMPAIGYENREESSLFYEIPGTSYNIAGSGRTVYYYLPARSTRNIHSTYKFATYSNTDFKDCMKTVWRNAYRKYAVINNNIDCQVARDILLQYVINSYGVINGIPQYFTNTDHFVQESGFLYRNADFACLLLEHGYSCGNIDIIDKAIGVIDAQVRMKLAGEKQIFPFERSRAEGVMAVLKAYRLLEGKGIEKEEWLEFVNSEICHFIESDEFYSIPLLCAMEMDEIAIKKAKSIWNKFSDMRFYGGIVDFIGEPVLDRESGMLGLMAFLAIYEKTKDKKWIERAAFCADYLETYQVLRLHNFKIFDVDGNEHYNMAAIGNENLFCNGLSYISANCSAGDVSNVFVVPYYYKLWKYLGDSHYLDYAKLLERNCLEYIDLNNKSGSMCDVMYGTGAGFMNEYFQLAISNDPVGPIAGAAHDSNIAWMSYGILSSQNEMMALTGKPYIDGISKEQMYQNIAKFCWFSDADKKATLTSGNLYLRTVFSKEECITVSLGNYQADKLVMSHGEKYVCYEYKIEFYKNDELLDYVIHKGAARFASFEIKEGCSKMKIIFLNDVMLRQLQIFGDSDTNNIVAGSNNVKMDDIYCNGMAYSSQEKFMEPWSCLSKENGVYSSLEYDNIKNAWCSKDPFLLIKSGNLVHPGKHSSVVWGFIAEENGTYEIERIISPAQYLNVFGRKVVASIYLDELLLKIQEIALEKKSFEKQILSLDLIKGQKMYFEIASKNGNENTLVCDDIQIKKKR